MDVLEILVGGILLSNLSLDATFGLDSMPHRVRFYCIDSQKLLNQSLRNRTQVFENVTALLILPMKIRVNFHLGIVPF